MYLDQAVHSGNFWQREKHMAPLGQIRPGRQRQMGSHDRVGAGSRKTKGSSALKVGAMEG